MKGPAPRHGHGDVADVIDGVDPLHEADVEALSRGFEGSDRFWFVPAPGGAKDLVGGQAVLDQAVRVQDDRCRQFLYIDHLDRFRVFYP